LSSHYSFFFWCTNTFWRPISASSEKNVGNPESIWWSGQGFAGEGGLNRLLSKAGAAACPGAGLKKSSAPYGVTVRRQRWGWGCTDPMQLLRSPWFGSHQLQVRAAGGREVGGKNAPLLQTRHPRAWVSLAQADGLRSEERRS